MNALQKRLTALENKQPSALPRWHCIRRYEDETDAQAIEAYEGEHGPIGTGNVVMRVIIDKPGSRDVQQIDRR